MKVVINVDYGGFSISMKAGEFMAARGNAQARQEVEDTKIYKDKWYGYGYVRGFTGGYPRNDPDLVAAVEQLGPEANGSCAKLSVVEIPDGVEFEISDYDGMEHIAEKHRTWH